MTLLQKARPSLPKGGFRAALISVLLLAPSGLAASPGLNTLDNPQLHGTATYRYLGLPLYNAQLFTQRGASFDWGQDFALELQYRRNVTKKALINSTLDEMERIGSPAPVRDQLETCFKAVKKGDRYLAVSDGPDRVSFWLNGAKTCTMSYPGIKRSFMSVFLGENTRSAAFSQKLRGQ
ncbi:MULTISPECIES: hypothetical protein [unclassified Ruegeria]|uniref:hypothetical protein n=1 Tax=unclassified Ruegeria TaxID=2625375 RepID=UPI001ADD5247|nr:MULTISPECIES: hypothetical protein [unclassified Ruegeria]MBO9412067.1 hypothetical protein [Ruegeria sp. R8_1]MBO9417176.1 hypothetical protein [Ruegeria sp. R8_2]